MTILLAQIFMLLLGAFLLGATTACLFRRVFSGKEEPVGATQTAARVSVPASKDRARFERALTGDPSAIVPPPFQTSRSVPVIEVQPAPTAPLLEPVTPPVPVVEVTADAAPPAPVDIPAEEPMPRGESSAENAVASFEPAHKDQEPVQAPTIEVMAEAVPHADSQSDTASASSQSDPAPVEREPSYTEIAAASSAPAETQEPSPEQDLAHDESFEPAPREHSPSEHDVNALEPSPEPVPHQPSYTEIAVAAAAAAALAAQAAAASVEEADEGPADDLTRIHSIDRALEQKLNELGVSRFNQIAGWAASDVARISQTLGFYGRIEQERWVEQAQEIARGAPVEPTLQKPPSDAPAEPAEPAAQLQRIIGIDPAIEQQLVANGVTRISDIAQWNWEDVDLVEALLDAPGRIGRERWVEQARLIVRGTDESADVADADAGDRLDRIIGIDAATEQLLVANGITRVSEIASWNWEDVDLVEALLGTPGRIGRERWVEQARVLARDGSADGADAGDRLDRIIGIDPATEQQLVANGITRISDIAQWNWEDIDLVEALLGTPGRVGRERWVEQARLIVRGTDGSEDAADTGDRLDRIIGIDAATEQQLVANGITRISEIASWNWEDVDRIEALLGTPGRIGRERWVEQARLIVRGTEGSAEDAEPLHRIIGIDPATEQQLVAHGVTRISEIAGWNWEDVDRIEALLGAPGRIGRERWVEQARVLARGTEGAAEDAEPLHRIIGIDPATEQLLVAHGVTRISEIAGWNWEDVDRIEALLGTPGRIGRENWIEQARVIARGTDPHSSLQDDTATIAAPVEQLHRIIGIDAATEQKLVVNGIMRVSDIAQWNWQDVERVEAILETPGRVERENWIEQARFLADGGTEFAQSEPAAEPPANPAGADQASGREAEPAETPAGPSTSRSDYAGLRSVRSEALLGEGAAPFYVAGQLDDLKRVRGIGILIEKRLNSLGVTSYEQIANWTSADVARFSEIFDFKGRIERENWIEQARILASGGQTEFSSRADRGKV